MSRSPRDRGGQSVDERAMQQCDLVRAQQLELDRQAEKHAKARQTLEAAQRRERLELQREHTRKLVDLWQRQGRELGPWTAPVVAGGAAVASEQKGKVGHG